MNLPGKLLLLCLGANGTLAVSLSALRTSASSCSDVTFEITALAQNAVFSPSPDSQNDTSFREFFDNSFKGSLSEITGTTIVNDIFSISGTYCIPENARKPVDTLQILIHGITYSKSFWSGFDFDDRYNWHKHANARGYATLAIDRLGNGKSSRPDPIHVVQPPLELALINQIVLASQGLPSAISPESNPFLTPTSPHRIQVPAKLKKHKYPNTILIGHSYGSYLAPALTNYYPGTKISALILTAFSTNFSLAFFAAQQWSPASVAFPSNAVFKNLPEGYFTQTNSTQREESFYAGGYDERVPQVDFANVDTLAAGSFGALATMLTPAGNFTGPVLAVTGELDRAVCQRPREKCGEIMETSGAFFPRLESGGEFTGRHIWNGKVNGKGGGGQQNGVYQYYIPTNTGHDLTLHYSAQETMGRVHDWLGQWV